MFLLKNTGDWSNLDVQECCWGGIIFWNNKHTPVLRSGPSESILHYPTQSWIVIALKQRKKKES